MLKRYTFWLWLAIVVLALNTIIHTITLFIQPAPQNEIERQLIHLMTTYHNDFGAGFHPTPQNLFTALSSCLSFLCLFGALMNGYLVRKRLSPEIMRGVLAIDLLVFGICFVVIVVFTFLVPIVLIGLIVVFLALAFITLPREPKNA
jgi:hypothetical protein